MILRSAFWLTVGFFVVAPHGTDLGAQASAVKDQVISSSAQAAEQLIVSQILGDQTMVRTVSKAVVAKLSSSIASSPSVAHPMQDSSTATFVFPRHRPVAMG
jgi:hypothetical protein